MKTLSKTVDLMNSEDYGDRLIAEYLQTCIRHEKLMTYFRYFDVKNNPHHYDDLLTTQSHIMISYISVLSMRLKYLGLFYKARKIWEDLRHEKE